MFLGLFKTYFCQFGIVAWKAYAVVTWQTVERIGNNAMKEYLKRHKLAGEEQMAFDILRTREENRRE